jgi:small-conductance mechanosensitive channel
LRRLDAPSLAFALALLALPGVCLGQGLPGLPQAAQETAPPPQQQAAAEPQPTAIEPAQVPNRAEQARAVLRQALQVAEPLGPDQAISPRLPGMAERIREMQADSTLGDPTGMDFRSLDSARQQWAGVRGTVQDWQAKLTSRSETLAKWRATAAQAMETWRLTIEALKQAGVSSAAVDTARGVLDAWKDADSKLRARQGEVLTVQSELTAQTQVVEEMLQSIAEVQSAARVNVLKPDHTPLWQGFRPLQRKRALPSIPERISADTSIAQGYVRGQGTAISIHLALTIVAFFVFLATRRWVAELAEKREDLRPTLAVFRRPLAATLALSLMANPWLYPDSPLAFKEAMAFIAMIPLIWLLPLVIAPAMRRPVYVLIALFILIRLTDLVSSGTGIARAVLLLYAPAAGAVAWWVFRPGGRAAALEGGRYWAAARTLGRLGAILLFASTALNILGFVSLADLLAEGTVRSALLGLWLFLVVAVVRGVFTALLFSRAIQVLNMARWSNAPILEFIVKIAGPVAALLWLWGSLRYFRLLEPTLAFTTGVLTASARIGSVSISLGDILGFIVAILVGVYLARFIRFVLTVEIFPRVTLPRGVPATIVMLVNYTVLGLAFVLAVAAAGIDLSNFALIAGALSVGIGFGLQNVVNNFVSGLILAFERPVQAGDAVQLGEMWGRVTRIGVRSSTVRTWGGAEVIVPNGDLISSQVTNWTLSDQQRRIEILAGVAYGTDPHKVIGLLVACAKQHSKVLASPEPTALFLGFGTSSLDFELRCWTDDFDSFLSIKSELTLAIHDALYEAGFEIPFPQRDLHLRSVDDAVTARLSGTTPARLQPRESGGGGSTGSDAGGTGGSGDS